MQKFYTNKNAKVQWINPYEPGFRGGKKFNAKRPGNDLIN